MALDPKAAEAVMLKAGYKPLEPFVKSHGKWKCLHISCGEIVYPSYHGISQGQGGCIHCGRKTTIQKRRLSESEAIQLMIEANLEPLEPYKSTKDPWESRCTKCGSVVRPRLSAIKQGQGGCKPCGSKATGLRQTRSQEDAIKILKSANLEPLVPYENSKTPWKCKCLDCGSIVKPTLNAIRDGGGGCRKCGSAKTAMLLTIPLNLALETMSKNHIKPISPYPGAKHKWESECLKCGRLIYPRLSDVSKGHAGCSYCANRKKDPKEAIEFMLSVFLEPLEPYKSAQARWKCKCLKCGNIVYPQFNNVQQDNGGCGYCSKKGIDLNKPSYLYLITHEILGAHKIGIGNVQEKMRVDRLKGNRGFLSTGWKIHKIWQFKNGAEATKVETAVFKVVRKDLKLKPYLSKEDMPKTRGESETVSADSITLLQLEKIIRKIISEIE